MHTIDPSKEFPGKFIHFLEMAFDPYSILYSQVTCDTCVAILDQGANLLDGHLVGARQAYSSSTTTVLL